MNVFALASDIMNVRIDAESGETVELIRNGDPMKMNWIAPSSGWGKVDGIQTCEVRKNNAGVLIIAENEQQKLMMSIEKCVRGEFYEETYRITNRSEIEFFLTHDNFALHYPKSVSHISGAEEKTPGSTPRSRPAMNPGSSESSRKALSRTTALITTPRSPGTARITAANSCCIRKTASLHREQRSHSASAGPSGQNVRTANCSPTADSACSSAQTG